MTDETPTLEYDELISELRLRYPDKAWAFFEQVRDATGYGGSRSADAVAFGLWPSQGLELHGFEVKSYRGDWLRELKKPAKADAVLGYCDRIWIATTQRGIVNVDELPPGWGLLEPTRGGLRATRGAERNPQARPLDRRFFASLMRQAQTYIASEIANQTGMQAKIDEAYRRGSEDGARGSKHLIEDATRELDSLRRSVTEFETASGVKIDRWGGERIGEAVKVVLEGRHHNIVDRLKSIKDYVDKALETWQKPA